MVWMLIGTGFILLNLLMPVFIGIYVYRDAKMRGMEAALWTLLAVLIPGFIGFIIYLVVRIKYSRYCCAQCGAIVEESYTVCPQCGVNLHAACPSCGQTVYSNWNVCAHCGASLPSYLENNIVRLGSKEGFMWLIVSAFIALLVALLIVIICSNLIWNVVPDSATQFVI